jgi:hypothetical protein
MNKISQVGGSHYGILSIQPVEMIAKYGLNWFQGEVLKYISRYPNKNGKQDLLKAKSILEMAIDQEMLEIARYDLFDPYELLRSPLLDYIHQFYVQEGFFREPNTSKVYFYDIIINLFQGKYRKALMEMELFIYSEYGDEE